MIRPYSTHWSSMAPSAPRMAATGRINTIPSSAMTMPLIMDTYTNRENSRFALSLSPAPIVMAMMALPPVPNINPTAPNIIRNGMIKFTAAKGVFPTKFDTKNPSTTPYIDVKIIMTMEGRVKRNNLLYVK